MRKSESVGFVARGWRRLAAAAAAIALALAACNGDAVTIHLPPPECTNNVAPGLAGSWQGALGDQMLTLALTEQCERVDIFGAEDWIVRGQWNWGGLAHGTTKFEPYFYSGRLQVFLATDSLATLTKGVMLTLPVDRVTGLSHLTGTATGSWPRDGAPGEVWARFDSMPVALDRR